MNYRVEAEQGFSDYFCTTRRVNVLCSPHTHSHIEFVFLLEGSLMVSVDEELITLTANQAALIMPYQIHYYQTIGNPEAFVIACPPEYIPDYRWIFRDQVFAPFWTDFSPATRRIIEEIMFIEEQDYLKNKALIYFSLGEFAAACSLVKRKSLEYDVYRSAIVYISSHYTENITLEDVARHAGVTSVHLSRVLNSRSKSGFSNMINSLRIFEAKRLLEQTSLSISDVAFEVGYGSIRNFNRIFQKYFGCRPSDVKNGVNDLTMN